MLLIAVCAVLGEVALLLGKAFWGLLEFRPLFILVVAFLRRFLPVV
jgi:hypothetical protein